ncbi:MAG: hypothetical protein ABI182_05310 [Candidatus Baltobacteraceae bacterium]
MKRLAAVIFAVTLFAVAGQAGLAMDSMHSSMHSSMMMPKCASGDPVVGVNMQTKMYMNHAQIKTKMAGMSKDKMHAMMMKNHMRMMCKSKADAMGAKMMKPPM